MLKKKVLLSICAFALVCAVFIGAQSADAELTVRAYLPILSTRPGNLPGDPCFTQQWNLYNSGQAGGLKSASLHMLNAWPVTRGSPAVTLAIVSSGLDGANAEFAGRVLAGRHFYGSSQQNDDTSDASGRGTALAAVAAAAGDNGLGIAGVSWGVQILPVRVPESWDPYFQANVARGIEFAADQGAQVILVDMASPLLIPQVQTAVQVARAKGALVIAPVGECDTTANPACEGASGAFYPAALSGVLAVTATDRFDQAAGFANHLNNSLLDAAAPGVEIPTGVNGESCTLQSGTGLAAAQAAGLAALVYAACPAYTAGQVGQALLENSDDLGTLGFDDVYGYGRLNAARTLLSGCTLAP